jgi:hypothetical protein
MFLALTALHHLKRNSEQDSRRLQSCMNGHFKVDPFLKAVMGGRMRAHL